MSSVLQGLSAEYRKPLTDPRTEWLSYTSALSSESTDSSDSDTARVGVRRTKQIKPEWMRTLSLDLSYDRYNIGGVASRSRLVLPGIIYDHKRADSDVFPTRGRRLTLESRAVEPEQQTIGGPDNRLTGVKHIHDSHGRIRRGNLK